MKIQDFHTRAWPKHESLGGELEEEKCAVPLKDIQIQPFSEMESMKHMMLSGLLPWSAVHGEGS